MTKTKKIAKAFGAVPSLITVPMRANNDVTNFLRKFDNIQKRTAKSKLILGYVCEHKLNENFHGQNPA